VAAISQLTGKIVRPNDDARTLRNAPRATKPVDETVHNKQTRSASGETPPAQSAPSMAPALATAPAQHTDGTSAAGAEAQAIAQEEPAGHAASTSEPREAAEAEAPQPRASASTAAKPIKKRGKTRSKLYFFAGLGTGLAAAAAAFLWFGHRPSGGAGPRPTGDGLKIAESSQQVVRLGGVETLVVSGFVSNIAEQDEALPNLRLELYNEKREVLKTGTTAACAPVLTAGASCRFSIKIESPDLDSAKGGHAIVWDK
jgi:hypothetical protein